MSTTANTQLTRIRTTRLAWRRPHLSRAVSRAPEAIVSAYGSSDDSAFPATAFVGALTSTATLFIAFGLLALPAAAFA